MIFVPNLAIIAGTGNKSGKTSMACRIIEQFRHTGIVAVKITPHLHIATPGLIEVERNQGYDIFQETNPGTDKDTSRMLKAGASGVYYARAEDEYLAETFGRIMELVPEGAPVVCESPALRYSAEPGLFIIMTSDINNNQKDIKLLLELPHVEFNLEKLALNNELPVSFRDGRWVCWQYGH
ncbi:MAG: molybdopterin-guanine dinucleotide biosynthesis protein B [Bacteroidales bacterium]|nr:molybdopterin-guanine dinucleotide biosynthesis protein B [Bacteroidales bacterium]